MLSQDPNTERQKISVAEPQPERNLFSYLRGTGTVINTVPEPEPWKMEPQKFSQTQYKIVYLISFI